MLSVRSHSAMDFGKGDAVTYRVIQWSTGNVGHHALRLLANHPELELVGLWVHSESKAGRDAGDLGGFAPTGVLATPIEPVLRPGTRRGIGRLRELVAELGIERVVVGLPLST